MPLQKIVKAFLLRGYFELPAGTVTGNDLIIKNQLSSIS
jgi:hypothetical protein